MHFRRLSRAAFSTTDTALQRFEPVRADLSLEEQVQAPLNLVLKLRNRAQLPALAEIIKAVQDKIDDAMSGLHDVHFARFLPTPDYSALQVITAYDGELEPYILDFVKVIGDEFNAILAFVDNAPPLPVQRYPREFMAFIKANNVGGRKKDPARVFTSYPHATVLDILAGQSAEAPNPTKAQQQSPVDSAAEVTMEVTPADLLQIQGNVVRGYRMPNARHFALRIVNGGGARRFIGGLADEDGPADQPHVTTARHWHKGKPSYCLNVGFTWEGLRAMGLPESMLSLFPETFQRGPSWNADKLGDTGESAPEQWEMGGPANPQVHVVLSLFTNEARDPQMDQWTTVLEREFRSNGLDVVWRRDAAAMRDENGKPDGRVHFGYQDGIAQPRIAGVPGPQREDMQPTSQPGEFLLGRQYMNQFGGNFAGSLPPQLADNATYAAFRVLQQDVAAFESFITTTGTRYNMPAELVAAKLMGRWRNGVPLTLSPNTDQPARQIPANELNNFDFAPSEENPTFYDDAAGLRCPVGAHIRRLNPRGALVAGMPHSRRIIRRGMPYGPAYNPNVAEQEPPERGLIGYFICGDLGLQFEFLQSAWANKDLSAAGLRGTRDPILGAHPDVGGRFVLRTEDSRDPIVFDNVPRWVRTRGSAYCFIPAIDGLRFLAGF